jgi:hypothetical protein
MPKKLQCSSCLRKRRKVNMHYLVNYEDAFVCRKCMKIWIKKIENDKSDEFFFRKELKIKYKKEKKDENKIN